MQEAEAGAVVLGVAADASGFWLSHEHGMQSLFFLQSSRNFLVTIQTEKRW